MGLALLGGNYSFDSSAGVVSTGPACGSPTQLPSAPLYLKMLFGIRT